MAKTYYIDGYNVIHHSSILQPIAIHDFESARNSLVERVAHFCAATGESAKIVFDGRGRVADRVDAPPGVRGLEIVYSSMHHSADTEIERAVYKSSDRRSIVVVSGDRGIQDLCMGMGALVMGPDNFFATAGEASASIDAIAEAGRKADGISSLEDRLVDADLDRLRRLKKKLTD